MGTVTANELIVDAAYAGLRGDLRLPAEPGMCLQAVRLIVERALYGGKYAWYAAQRVVIVDQTTRASTDPYARDMESSLKQIGHALSLPRLALRGDPGRYVNIAESIRRDLLKPGDLVFRWDTAADRNGVYIGHVGVLLHGHMVLENVAVRPQAFVRGATKLSRLGDWPATTIARLTLNE